MGIFSAYVDISYIYPFDIALKNIDPIPFNNVYNDINYLEYFKIVKHGQYIVK